MPDRVDVPPEAASINVSTATPRDQAAEASGPDFDMGHLGDVSILANTTIRARDKSATAQWYRVAANLVRRSREMHNSILEELAATIEAGPIRIRGRPTGPSIFHIAAHYELFKSGRRIDAIHAILQLRDQPNTRANRAAAEKAFNRELRKLRRAGKGQN